MPDVAGERVHAGDEFAARCGVVVRQVATDQLGDQLGLGGGNSFWPTSVASADVVLERSLGRDDRAHRGGGDVGLSAIRRSVVAIDAIV